MLSEKLPTGFTRRSSGSLRVQIRLKGHDPVVENFALVSTDASASAARRGRGRGTVTRRRMLAGRTYRTARSCRPRWPKGCGVKRPMESAGASKTGRSTAVASGESLTIRSLGVVSPISAQETSPRFGTDLSRPDGSRASMPTAEFRIEASRHIRQPAMRNAGQRRDFRVRLRWIKIGVSSIHRARRIRLVTRPSQCRKLVSAPIIDLTQWSGGWGLEMRYRD